MRFPYSLFSWCFDRVLGLLPDSFTVIYGEEMRCVFAQNMLNAGSSGLLACLRTGLRELNGLLRLLFSERWQAALESIGFGSKEMADNFKLYADRNLSMNANSKNEIWRYAGSASAWVASLPPLIFGLGGALTMLAALTNNLYLVVAVWALSVLVIVLGGLAALLKRLPDWSWTWTGSGLMLIAVSLKILAEELAETGGCILSPTGDLVLMGLILLAGFVLLLAAAWHGWQPAGLVSLGYTSIFGLVNLSLLSSAPLSRIDLALLALPAGLVFSLLIILFIRGNNTGRVLLLGGAWLLNAAIFMLQHILWHPWLVERGSTSPLIPLLVFSTGFVLSGPLVGVLRKPFLKVLGKV